MPTARELLEQADALMRRNRALPPSASRSASTPVAEPAAPPASASAVTSPRPIQREPIAPSVVHTSLPLEETDGVEFTEPVAVQAPPRGVDAKPPEEAAAEWRVETSDDGEFPVLTDAVDEHSVHASAADDDDLPLLTDAVTQIGSVSVDEAARGEPSLWELTSRGESSVLGPAPDSVMRVPADAPPAVPLGPPQGRDPLGFDQPAPGFDPPQPAGDRSPAITEDAAKNATDEAFAGDEARVAVEAAPEAPEDAPPAYPEDDDEPHVFSAAVAHMPPEDAEEAAVGAGDPPAPGASATGIEEAQVGRADGVELAYGSLAQEVQPAEPVAESDAEAAPADPLPREESASQTTAFDQQRIREVAEEIGMQVLQRIDIFTDTTLRAQLGERLRPAVDRAAADIVAAINEHVGELLRAQVAEAIEREIESWKRGSR